MADQAESTLARVCRGAGSTEEGKLVHEAFEKLAYWAGFNGLADAALVGAPTSEARQLWGLIEEVDTPTGTHQPALTQLLRHACDAGDIAAMGNYDTEANRIRAVLQAGLEVLIKNGLVRVVPLEHWPEYVYPDGRPPFDP